MEKLFALRERKIEKYFLKPSTANPIKRVSKDISDNFYLRTIRRNTIIVFHFIDYLSGVCCCSEREHNINILFRNEMGRARYVACLCIAVIWFGITSEDSKTWFVWCAWTRSDLACGNEKHEWYFKALDRSWIFKMLEKLRSRAFVGKASRALQKFDYTYLTGLSCCWACLLIKKFSNLLVYDRINESLAPFHYTTMTKCVKSSRSSSRRNTHFSFCPARSARQWVTRQFFATPEKSGGRKNLIRDKLLAKWALEFVLASHVISSLINFPWRWGIVTFKHICAWHINRRLYDAKKLPHYRWSLLSGRRFCNFPIMTSRHKIVPWNVFKVNKKNFSISSQNSIPHRLPRPNTDTTLTFLSRHKNVWLSFLPFLHKIIGSQAGAQKNSFTCRSRYREAH